MIHYTHAACKITYYRNIYDKRAMVHASKINENAFITV